MEQSEHCPATRYRLLLCTTLPQLAEVANENLNGLIRYYFPKGTNFDKIDEQAIKRAVNKLNNRPRKRLDYKLPNEVHSVAINNEGIVAFMT